MKKTVKLLIVLLFIFSFNVYAQETTTQTTTTEQTTTQKYNDGSLRSDMENHGVNKKWNINEKNLPNVMRTPYVDS